MSSKSLRHGFPLSNSPLHPIRGPKSLFLTRVERRRPNDPPTNFRRWVLEMAGMLDNPREHRISVTRRQDAPFLVCHHVLRGVGTVLASLKGNTHPLGAPVFDHYLFGILVWIFLNLGRCPGGLTYWLLQQLSRIIEVSSTFLRQIEALAVWGTEIQWSLAFEGVLPYLNIFLSFGWACRLYRWLLRSYFALFDHKFG